MTTTRTGFDDINLTTGFANGDKFDSPDEVRSYFTVENMNEMFGQPHPDETRPAQEQLDEWAEQVIANGWHMRTK